MRSTTCGLKLRGAELADLATWTGLTIIAAALAGLRSNTGRNMHDFFKKPG